MSLVQLDQVSHGDRGASGDSMRQGHDQVA